MYFFTDIPTYSHILQFLYKSILLLYFLKIYFQNASKLNILKIKIDVDASQDGNTRDEIES